MIDETKKMKLDPATLLNPVPVVMVSCSGKNKTDPQDRPNIITLAWVGTVCSEPPMVSISVRKSRYSHALISETGEFVINLVNRKLARACDYCGVKSGEKENKFDALSLDAIPADGLEFAPAIAQAPVSISCKVTSVTQLGSLDMFLAKIVAISADANLMDKAGKLRLENADLVCYSHGDYYLVGEPIGFFGYSISNQEVFKKRMKAIRDSQTRAKSSKKAAPKEKKLDVDLLPNKSNTHMKVNTINKQKTSQKASSAKKPPMIKKNANPKKK